MNLEDFEARESGSSGRKRCMTCSLAPEIRRQVEEGRERSPKPIPYPVISRWLEQEHGIKIQQNTIRNHFVVGHQNG